MRFIRILRKSKMLCKMRNIPLYKLLIVGLFIGIGNSVIFYLLWNKNYRLFDFLKNDLFITLFAIVILFIITIPICYSKYSKLPFLLNIRIYLYCYVAILLFFIIPMIGRYNTKVFSFFSLHLNKVTYLLILGIIEGIGAIILTISILYQLKLTSKERLQKIRVPFFILVLGIILWMLRPLQILQIDIIRPWLWLIGIFWILKISIKLKDQTVNHEKLEQRISKIIYCLLKGK